MSIALYIVFGVLLFSLLFYLLTVIVASRCIYTRTLMRRSKEQWGRGISEVNERTLRMDEEGMSWQREHNAYKHDVHIINEGLNLYGEYYDMGHGRTVIILSGRTESLRYGYYFARPYSDSGFNVLVIDPRAHGWSDGKYNTLGFDESRDVLAWTRYLEKEFSVDTVIFHGICIGAAGGMLAITSPDCPDVVKGMVTEGMFANFGESMRNHLIERKRLMFPVMQCIDFWMKLHTGHSMMKGPIDVISSMDKPLLMLQSRMDKYSTPDNAEKLYSLCSSKEKELVFFETGDHSMLRITDTERYDGSIMEFLSKNFSISRQRLELNK